MKTSIYLGHADPRQGVNPKMTLYWINLHALLFKRPVIQDNFLISQHFQEVDKISKHSFPDLFRNGFLTIAFREGIVPKTEKLRERLATMTREGDFIPFEGKVKGSELYESLIFKRYLSRIDSAVNPRKFIRWSPPRLGARFRDVMSSSAADGSSGLSPDLASNVFAEIDKIAETNAGGKPRPKGPYGIGHNRSMYWKLADRRPDEKVAKQIKAWAASRYIRNLPDAYDLSLSLPNAAFREFNVGSPFDLLGSIPVETKAGTLQGIDRILLNPDIMCTLDPDSIGAFRSFKEFNDLQVALEGNDSDRLTRALIWYLKQFSEEIAKYHPRYRKKIAWAKAKGEFQIGLAASAGLVGLYFAGLGPLAPYGFWLLAYSLARKINTKSLIDKARQEIDVDLSLRYDKYKKSTEGLSDLCHEVNTPPKR